MVVFTGVGVPFWTWSADGWTALEVKDENILRLIRILDVAADSNGNAAVPGVGFRCNTAGGTAAYEIRNCHV